MNSIPAMAKALDESKSTKITLSVSLIIALVAGGYWAGTQARNPSIEERQAAKIEQIEVTLSRVTTILENQQDEMEKQQRDITAIAERTHKMHGEMMVINSRAK